MRNPVPFDTHAVVKRLTAAGVPESQAEVHAETLADLVLSQLASKEDLRLTKEDLKQGLDALHQEFVQLETRLTHRIEMGEQRLEKRMTDMELKLTVRVGVMLAAGFGIMTAILRLFFIHP
jgi:hypothetical protein